MRILLFLDNTSYPVQPLNIFCILFVLLLVSVQARGQARFSLIRHDEARCIFLYRDLSSSPSFMALNSDPGLTIAEVEDAPPRILPVNVPLFAGSNAPFLIDSSSLFTWDNDSLDNSTGAPPQNTATEQPLTYTDDGGKAPSVVTSNLLEHDLELLANKYSEMIRVNPDEVNNVRLYQFIDQWYGVRYKWGGMDRSGIDCSAFSQKLYGSIYSLKILRTARMQHRSCEILRSYSDAEEGDLVFFRMHHLGISHVGVYLANGYFVHASRSHGVVISSLGDRYWRRRFAGCGRMERQEQSGTESNPLQ